MTVQEIAESTALILRRKYVSFDKEPPEFDPIGVIYREHVDGRSADGGLADK